MVWKSHTKSNPAKKIKSSGVKPPDHVRPCHTKLEEWSGILIPDQTLPIVLVWHGVTRYENTIPCHTQSLSGCDQVWSFRHRVRPWQGKVESWSGVPHTGSHPATYCAWQGMVCSYRVTPCHRKLETWSGGANKVYGRVWFSHTVSDHAMENSSHGLENMTPGHTLPHTICGMVWIFHTVSDHARPKR